MRSRPWSKQVPLSVVSWPRSMVTRSLATSLALSAWSALAACGDGGGVSPAAWAAGPASTQQAIINGETCDASVEPTAVGVIFDGTIEFDNPFDGSRVVQDLTTVLCTGTLIAPDVVLLAAHCVNEELLGASVTGGFVPSTVSRADFYVSFEPDLTSVLPTQQSTTPPLPASALPARAVVAHPGFNVQSLGEGVDGTENDIALLFLDAAVTDVVPEVVVGADEAAQLITGMSVRIAGWGQQTLTSPQQQPPPGSVGVKKCGTSTINEVGPALLQVGADTSTTRKCHGDSGGPTYAEVDTTSPLKRRVIGVTSRAYNAQEDCARGGVDTRVDAFLPFLDDQLVAHCNDGSRVWCDVPGLLTLGDVERLAGVDAPAEGEGEGDGGDGGDAAEGEGDDEVGATEGCAQATPASTAALAILGAGLALAGGRRRRSQQAR